MQRSNQIHNPMLYVGLKREGRKVYLKEVLSYIPIDQLIEKFEKVYGISFDEISSKSRKREIVMIRMIFSHLAYKKCRVTLKEIGRKINRDYSTVIYQRYSFDALYETDKKFKQLADKIL